MAPIVRQEPDWVADALLRLETLQRTPDQDVVIRRLLNAGLKVITLDMARVRRLYAGESFTRETYLIFRDQTGMRWVVDRSGRMSTSGRTEWVVVP